MNATSTSSVEERADTLGQQRRRAELLTFLEKYALVLLFALLCLFFATYPATSETFVAQANIRNILGNETVLAIAALASIVPLTCGQFDLSVGATIGLSSIITGSAVATHHLPLVVAVLLGMISGVVIGLANGWLVAYRGVNSLIATLGTSTLVAGFVSFYTENQVLSVGIPESLTNFGTGQVMGVPQTLFALALVAVAVYYTLRHTPYGRYLASVGASPSSARLVGLNVRRMVLSSFVLAGAISGSAGVVLLARAATANPTVGPGYTLSALTAAFLGATAFRPGTFNVAGTLLAVLFVAVSVNGLVLAGAADWVEPTFNGAALLIAVAVSQAIAVRRSGSS